MDSDMTQFDIKEIVKRAFKYFVEGAMVAIAAFYIPQRKMNLEEVAMTKSTFLTACSNLL